MVLVVVLEECLEVVVGDEVEEEVEEQDVEGVGDREHLQVEHRQIDRDTAHQDHRVVVQVDVLVKWL